MTADEPLPISDAALAEVLADSVERWVRDGCPAPQCGWFWGSHGCDLDEDHDGPCQCGLGDDVCCQLDRTTRKVRHTYLSLDPDADPDWHWGEWAGDWEAFR